MRLLLLLLGSRWQGFDGVGKGTNRRSAREFLDGPIAGAHEKELAPVARMSSGAKGQLLACKQIRRNRLQLLCPDHVSMHQHQLKHCHTIRMDATKNDLTAI
ncbi:unnamed protein product [Cercospora beticola]|nr:unnamed protein product [Cercospora beticola]